MYNREKNELLLKPDETLNNTQYISSILDKKSRQDAINNYIF